MRQVLLILFLLSIHLSQAQKTSKLQVLESAEYKDEVKTFDIKSIHTTSSNRTGIVREGKRDLLFDVFDRLSKKRDDLYVIVSGETFGTDTEYELKLRNEAKDTLFAGDGRRPDEMCQAKQ